MKKYGIVLFGTMLIALSLNLFLIPAKIAAGGISGIATILQNTLGIKASFTVLALNIPLLILAWFYCGKPFFFRTFFGSFSLAFFLELFSGFSPLVEDAMLSAIAGGLLVGIGMGFIFRADASTGGTDIIAILLQKKKPHLPISFLLLVADGLVIVLSGFLFRSFETMIYACITLYITSKVIDSIVVGLDYAKEVTVFSDHAEKIASEILVVLNKGATAVQCTGFYSGKEKTMLIVVLKKNQIVKMKNMIEKYDKNAFVVISEVKEVIGKGFKK